MEKPNGGELKLPIGYRFHPTDEELIVHYLRRKIFGSPLPASVIPELNVFEHDPWTLPGDLKDKRYYFGRKMGENKSKIATCSGYWKPVGKTRPILTSFNHIVGLKKTLLFCHIGNHSEASSVQWVMQEYQLLGSATIPHKIQVSKSKLGEWVVYRLFQRRRRPKRQHQISSNVMNCTVEESPCSNGITEAYSRGLDLEEITSFQS